jgi:hypothetical protein
MKTRFFSVFLFAALIAAMFGAGQPTHAQAQALDPASLLKPDGTLDLTSNPHGVFDLRGWDVALDSARGPILSPQNRPTNAPASGVWSALPGNGLNGYVEALAVIGTDLYVGGSFTETADGSVVDLNNIAKFDGANWTALSNQGLNGAVTSLAVIGTDLYVGGVFTRTKDNSQILNYVAKYSGGAWHPLSHNDDIGLNAWVSALAAVGPDLYVGGVFTETKEGQVKDLHYIAKYSNGDWSALPGKGLNSNVTTLATMGSDLYAGGNFFKTFDESMDLHHIAKFSGGVWSALPGNGLNDGVQAFAVSGSDLYVGGNFTGTRDNSVLNLNKVAKFSGGAWSPLPGNGLNNEALAMTAVGADIYVGGGFGASMNHAYTDLNNIARLNGNAWHALANKGLNDYVTVILAVGTDLYVGGAFTQTADGNVTNLNRIAKLTTTSASVATFRSAGAQDGWILESGENTNKGGTLNSAAATFRLGDDAAKKQYRAILSFKTASLPDNAVITKITLKVKRQGVTGGGDPVNAFQGFTADVKKGTFGTSALQAADFQAAANKTLGPVKPTPNGGWYSINLTGAKAFVNKLAANGGLTQIRLRFKLDDNNNAVANYLSLFSGNAPLASRPQLIVEYYVP